MISGCHQLKRTSIEPQPQRISGRRKNQLIINTRAGFQAKPEPAVSHFQKEYLPNECRRSNLLKLQFNRFNLRRSIDRETAAQAANSSNISRYGSAVPPPPPDDAALGATGSAASGVLGAMPPGSRMIPGSGSSSPKPLSMSVIVTTSRVALKLVRAL